MVSARKWLLASWFECQHCGWTPKAMGRFAHRKASREAREHNERTGHLVVGELTYRFEYDRKEPILRNSQSEQDHDKDPSGSENGGI